MKIAHDITELIGNTPLVELHHVVPPGAGRVIAKVEYFNPGGSVKDRIALAMILAAEKEGKLAPGGTIIEPTSGNTGVGLALVAQQRGYHCIFVCPNKVSSDKQNVLRAYGAQVIVCPSVPPDHPESYYRVSDRLALEIPGAWKPDQYSNPYGPASHYQTTGPEIWADTNGELTHFVAGIGTGGTITGTGRYLHEVSHGKVRIIGADPQGSVYSGGSGRPYLVEGVGKEFWPAAYDPSIVDEVIAVNDADAFAMTRQLAYKEGLLVGGSCGMAVVAAVEVAVRSGPDSLVVVLLPDGGRGYLSKIFNDDWLRSYGFDSPDSPDTTGVTPAKTACAIDILTTSPATIGTFDYAYPTTPIEQVITLIQERNISHLPIVLMDPPVRCAEVVGSLSNQDLIDILLLENISLTDPISTVMSPALPRIGAYETIPAVNEALQHNDALLVVDKGDVIGIINRHDVANFLTRCSLGKP